MQSFVENRWFPIIDLLFTAVAAFLWLIGAGWLSWQPLLIALFPWGARAAAGRFPFRRTSLDGLLLIFLITAGISVSFAYNSQQAMGKFWILVGAVLLFYALAAQSRRDVWLLASSAGGLSVLLVGYFLLTNDWQVMPSDMGFVNWIGVRWMRIRPSLSLPLIHPNTIGGILAIFIPFQIALYLYSQRIRPKPHIYEKIALGTGLIAVGGLFATSSRAAWLALAIGLFVWWVWGQSDRVAQRQKMRQMTVFVTALVSLAAGLMLIMLILPDGLAWLAGRLPGNETATSRLVLAESTLDLIGDYPFLGAGLASFGGLYSQYIAVTPFFLFNYGHQFFLDVLLEQGVLGLVSLVAIHFIGIWLLLRRAGHDVYTKLDEFGNGQRSRQPKTQPLHLDLFRWAIIAAGVTVTFHSLIDDPLYGFMGTPFLFLLPGLVVAVSTRRDAAPVLRLSDWWRPGVVVPLLVIGLGLVVAGWIWQRPLQARWLSTQGAVAMARIELVNWPTNRWDDGSQVDSLAPAAAQFQQALALNPADRTANYRLGLIAMLQRDYETAVRYLQTAHQQDPDHFGVRKSLGYSYTWLGEYDAAVVFLADIPEAPYELTNYVSWWQRNGRQDYANHAAEMAQLLQARNPADAAFYLP